MEFTLVYQGPLKSNGSAKHKHEIRMALHPQLEELWGTPPIGNRFWVDLRTREKSLNEALAELTDSELSIRKAREEAERASRDIVETVGGLRFIPLVTARLSLTCSLRVLLLRPGQPGNIVHGADLDNRLKTLLDALTVPDANQVASLRPRGDPRAHLFCLLQDDALVTDLSIEADRLLGVGKTSKDVLAVVRVRFERSVASPFAMKLP